MATFQKPLDGALYLLDKGFKVFPLKPNQKDPAFTGWQEWAKKATRKRVQEFGTANSLHNWGVYLGATGHMAIDVDNKHGKDGSKNFTNLILQRDEIPTTLTVTTPSNGIHYYFKGECLSREDNLATGVDTKSRGGYVVAPGSRINDVAYEVVADPGGVADAPQWILDLANRPTLNGQKPIDTVVPPALLDKEHHLDKVKDYLVRTSASSIAGQMGNKTLYATACMVKNLGITDPDQAMFLMAEYYDPRCQPSWLSTDEDRERWEKTIRSAYQHSQEAAGSKTEEARIQEAREDFIDSYKGPRRFSDFKGDAPERQWLIPDWLPLNEISSMYGSGGSGKSLLSLQIALSVATGRTFMGLNVSTPLPTLCVYCEDSTDEIHRRLAAITAAPEFDFDNELKHAPLFLWPRVGEENDLAKESEKGNDVIPVGFYQHLDHALSEMPKGHKFLILDTLSDIYLGSENDRGKVNKFIKTILGHLIKKHEATVLFLAHPSRAGQNTGDMLSGSTAWENSVRNRLVFGPHKKYPEVTILTRMKSNYAKRGEVIAVKWDQGRFRTLDETEAKAVEGHSELDAYAEALDILFRQNPEPRSATEIAKELATSESVAHLFAGAKWDTLKRKLKDILKNDLVFEGAKFVGAKIDPNAHQSHFIIRRIVEEIDENDEMFQ